MIQDDINLLHNEGWEIEREYPFELFHPETNSFARGLAASHVLNDLRRKYEKGKTYFVLRKANCGTVIGDKPQTDIIGITSNEETAKERISIFCYYEPVISLD